MTTLLPTYSIRRTDKILRIFLCVGIVVAIGTIAAEQWLVHLENQAYTQTLPFKTKANAAGVESNSWLAKSAKSPDDAELATKVTEVVAAYGEAASEYSQATERYVKVSAVYNHRLGWSIVPMIGGGLLAFVSMFCLANRRWTDRFSRNG